MMNDFIHMTQGELLIKYWWLWLFFVVIGVIVMNVSYKRKAKELNDRYDKLENKIRGDKNE